MSYTNLENKIKEFYLVTNEFCKLLENTATFTKLDFLSSTQKLLNLLYLKASLIEKPKVIEEGEAEKFVQESDWVFIKDLVSSKLALSDKYIDLTMPENYDPENIEAITLSECFADIYQDIRDFSTNYEIGNSTGILVSLFECLENFEKFWGIRVLATLVSIHNLIYGGEVINDELIEDNKKVEHKKEETDTNNWIINQRFRN
jgi:hypothetical protein